MTKEQSWNHATRLIDSVFSLKDVPMAQKAMEEHLAKYPEDDARDPWHGWTLIVEGAEALHQEAVLLGVDADEEARRDALLRSSYNSDDFFSDPGVIDELQNTLDALAQWLIEHPEDHYAAKRHVALTSYKQLAEEWLAQYRAEQSAAERDAT